MGKRKREKVKKEQKMRKRMDKAVRGPPAPSGVYNEHVQTQRIRCILASLLNKIH